MSNIKISDQEYLAFMWLYQHEYGRPPTVREMGRALTVPSTSTVAYRMKRLVKKGLVTPMPATGMISRGYMVKSPPSFMLAPVPARAIWPAGEVCGIRRGVGWVGFVLDADYLDEQCVVGNRLAELG